MKHAHLLATVAALALTSNGQAQQTSAAAPSDESEIVVTGQRAQQERGIAAKRTAIGVLDVVAADELARLPDRNVAEVVERLPGVGVTYDQGEGRFVAVRGIPSSLNGYAINGLEIGTPENGNTRALPLDIISGQLLNRVEVAKVKTPDADGQGIGGTINLVTQTAFDYRERSTIVLNAQAGKQQFNNKVPVRGDASVATRFGANDQFGIVLGGSYSDRTFISYGFYPDNWAPNATAKRGGIPINSKYTNYTLTRERIGATASLDWRPNETTSLFVRGLFSRFTEDENRPRWRLDFGPTFVVNADGVTGTATGTPSSATGVAGTGPERRVDLRLDDKRKQILTVSAGGSTMLGGLKLDAVGGYVRNRVSDEFPLWQFRCNTGPIDVNFSSIVFTNVPRAECTPAQLQFRQYSFNNQKGRETLWQGKLDGTYDLAALGEGSFLKAGVKYRQTDRLFEQQNDIWTRGGNAATRFTLGQFNLQGPNFNVYPDQKNSDRAFLNAPTIDPAKMLEFTAANLNGPFFVRDIATSLANGVLADLDVDEDVTAGYAMAQLRFGQFTLTPGLRYERTKLDLRGFRLDRGTIVTPLFASNRYSNWLPSLIGRFEPTAQIVVRGAYSRSLGRPEYGQLNPGGTLSFDTVDQLSLGNPDLKPYVADNADVSAEWYFARGGLFSVGLFRKWIKDPIFTRVTNQVNGVYAGVTYPTLRITQPINGTSGDIEGIEAQLQQQFRFLPGLLSGLGIELTGTLTRSKLTTADGRKVDFPQQSKYLYGASLFYQMGRIEASIAYHNTGKSLLLLGAVANDDQYNNDLRRLDAKASFALRPNISVFVEAQNLTDEPTRQYQAGRTDWIIQNERYGRTFYGGVSAKF